MWYILDMPNISADIDNLKKDLERAHTELLQMYQELGEVSFAWHDAIGYEPSQEPYEKLVGLVREKDDVDRRIEALKTAVSEMSAGDRGIEQTKLSMKELDNRFSVLISSLGAVAIEIESAGKLPQRLKKCLEPMREYERKLNELGRRLLLRRESLLDLRLQNLVESVAFGHRFPVRVDRLGTVAPPCVKAT